MFFISQVIHQFITRTLRLVRVIGNAAYETGPRFQVKWCKRESNLPVHMESQVHTHYTTRPQQYGHNLNNYSCSCQGKLK